MSNYLYLRDKATETLEEFSSKIGIDGAQQLVVDSDDIEVCANDETIRVGTEEMALTPNGIEALGDYMQVPLPYLKRCDQELQEFTLNHLLRAQQTPTKVIFSDHGIREVREDGKDPIEPHHYVDILQRVVAPNAIVVDGWSRLAEFYCEVIPPEKFRHGWGGDKPTTRRKDDVGDLTAGGVTIFQDRARGLAPQVWKNLYRVVCTNGLHIVDNAHKIDARGQTVDEVLAEIEALAQQEFAEVEHDIATYYSLRGDKVANPERELVRIAEENGIQDRPMRALLDLARSDALPDRPTMFDITNLITNLANEPTIARRAGARWKLMRAGGAVVTDHAARCGHCRARVTT